MNNISKIVQTFSNANLKIWIEYLWSLRGYCSCGDIKVNLHRFRIWKLSWENALSVWDAKNRSRNDLWCNISPSNSKRYKFLM